MLRTTAILALGLSAPALGSIVNGDFSAGNTGFSTDYAYRVVSDPPNFGQYGVTSSSFAWSQFWNTIPGDHTTGNGLFLICDVGPGAIDIWRQTVAVTPNTNYTLSAWLATWTSFPATTVNVLVDGVVVGSMSAPGGATWTQRSAAWNSGAATSSVISLRAATYFQPGDDVAIDDITLVPAPGALVLGALAMPLLARRRR